MNRGSDTTEFYDALPRLTRFSDLADLSNFTPLPDDWVLGTADVAGSTRAIAEGRYKTVNMVGAAVISAQVNGHAGRAFPYVFGGDGASFACAPDQAGAAADALAAVQLWAQDEFNMTLRTAQTPVSTVRGVGLDVAVARYQASPGVDYAMFSGGGLNWLEEQMKTGAFAVPPAPEGTEPDLTGLSCRWSNMKSQNGVILSVLVLPSRGTGDAAFAEVAHQVISIADGLSRDGHPVPAHGPGVRWPPPGLTIEAHVSRRGMSLTRRVINLLISNLIAWGFFKTGLKAGEFDPVHYAATVSRNADFRKFDDGLKMTLDCDAATLAQLQKTLEAAQQAGILRYGLFEQDEAMMTCIVPSITEDSHVHFVDGAAGGYAQAAAQIKAK
jgi:hypothetical protein